MSSKKNRSKKKKIKLTGGIKHYSDVDIEQLPEGSDKEVVDMLGQSKAKIRITTMIDIDILNELKKRATSEGDGRYQTYLNQLLREVLILKKPISRDIICEIVKETVKDIVKASSLKKQA